LNPPGLIGREVAAGFHGPADARVDALDRVHTSVRISTSKRRNGTNSAHAFSHSLMIAG